MKKRNITNTKKIIIACYNRVKKKKKKEAELYNAGIARISTPPFPP